MKPDKVWEPPLAEKVAHVKKAMQFRPHGCHWPGCKKQVPPAMWGCRVHWHKLPQRIRKAIWRTYRIGQEQRMDPSPEYIAVARAAEEWAMAQEALDK